MINMTEKIRDYLIRNNDDASGLADYLSVTGIDERYKAKLLAASCGWTRDTSGKTKAIAPSGIIQYMGRKYYFFCWRNGGGVEVERCF